MGLRKDDQEPPTDLSFEFIRCTMLLERIKPFIVNEYELQCLDKETKQFFCDINNRLTVLIVQMNKQFEEYVEKHNNFKSKLVDQVMNNKDLPETKPQAEEEPSQEEKIDNVIYVDFKSKTRI